MPDESKNEFGEPLSIGERSVHLTAPPTQLYLRQVIRSIDVEAGNPCGHNIESRVPPEAIALDAMARVVGGLAPLASCWMVSGVRK